ncbi:hypothetical protein CAEBREN_01466 [Caenorhabditis brenneri]|uniref:ribonuclease H n=1 Tax=Caenorhabditis brenneri TaxID=135651 RepID=G0PNY1_CAEBE|nr:hypothetical protein CAEBREN_01466 [Caenorhabditis brenneri]
MNRLTAAYRLIYDQKIANLGIAKFQKQYRSVLPVCMKYKVIAEVYTDGSCSFNGKMNARAAIGVWWKYEPQNNHSEKVDGIQENNRAELAAAVHAIDQAAMQGYCGIKVKVDSEFVIKAINKIIDFTKPSYNGKYQDLMEILDALKEEIVVSVQYVKAHSGILGNEQADRLAKSALKPEKVNKLAGSVKNETQKKAATAKRSKATKVEENGSGSKNNKKETPKLEGKKN